MRDVRCRVTMMRLERTRMWGEGRVSGTDGMCAGARVTMRASRRIARARVRGKTGRVSAPRAVPTDSDATKRHSAFRRDSSENPRFPNCRVVRFPRSTRVSTSRVPSWGVSCLCQPQRGRSRAPSPRATSPERSFGATDRANPQKRFSPRPCAGVNLETENALAECVRNSVVGVPTGATDPQVSRRCRARLRVRPRRPEEWQARVARVRLTSRRFSTFTSAPGCLVSAADVGLSADRPVVLPFRVETSRRVPRPRGGGASLRRTHTARLESSSARERESPHANGAERAPGSASDSRVPSRCQPPKTRST
jgi:hypothetical protein